ncbi:lipocalin-like domain-containing protein [Bradyrhizobium sp. CCBAU 53421]|uniref:lipocalin-like domain-containing protein n=1 Tax=Bradyrhizobium sp. CCBAU 53421 TaxID=1325120 RepID=UPI00188AD307|nr:lipocalin-like domain-containing protein [Bradyrhizobium sp. CCBAU 53421]
MQFSRSYAAAMRIVALTVIILLQTGVANAQESVVGVWKAVSIETKDVATGQTTQPFGALPNAMFIFTKGGHFANILTGANRKPPEGRNPTDAERAELHRSMSAYSGTFRVEGNKLIMTITTSSMQSWNGMVRTLDLEFQGNRVQGTSEPFKSAIGSGNIVAVNVWERVE